MKIIEFFDEVVTLREYNGYFYNVGQAIAIVILGLMSGLKNLNQSINGQKMTGSEPS